MENSVEGYILALETINRLSIKYRVEDLHLLLICNAWELLLKAKILGDAGNDRNAIYRGKKKRGERWESLSLRECLDHVIPNKSAPERRNVECIADLRDEAVHLVLLLCTFTDVLLPIPSLCDQLPQSSEGMVRFSVVRPSTGQYDEHRL